MSADANTQSEPSYLRFIKNLRSISDVYKNASLYLESENVEGAQQNVKLIMWYLLDISPTDIVAFPNRELDKSELFELIDALKRRAKGEPLQYICKKAPFRYADLECRQGVFIPRPETEVLVDRVLCAATVLLSECDGESSSPGEQEQGECGQSYLSQNGHNNANEQQCHNESMQDPPSAVTPASTQNFLQIADLCCGSGTIAVSVASECEYAQVFATDISQEAVELAQKNAHLLGVSDRVSVKQGSLFDPLGDQKFNMVLSNPPYIPTAKIANMPREVVDFEPMEALDGGPDGLDIFRQIVDGCSAHLKAGGFLICELDEDTLEQACDICANCKDAVFSNIIIVRDLAGRNRIIEARRCS